MKGFIHVYECEESLVKDFKEFARAHSCDRYNSALRYLLDFHETFQKSLNTQEKEKEQEQVKENANETEKLKDDKPKCFGGGN